MLRKVVRACKHGTLLPALKTKVGLKKDHLLVQNEINDLLKLPEQEAVKTIDNIVKKQFAVSPLRTYGLPIGYLKELTHLLVLRRLSLPFPEEEYEDLLRQTDLLETSLLSTEQWKMISFLSLANGLFQLGGKARQKAVEEAFIKGNLKYPAIINVYDAFKAAVDQGDFITAEKMLSIIDKKYFNDEEIIHIKLYYHLLNGNKDIAWLLAKRLFNNLDLEYSDYLIGKNVTVVGPAPSGYSSAIVIDSSDVVIRLNYRGSKYMPDPLEFGSKINVSYYNGECAKHINGLESKDFIDRLEFAVFKKIKFTYQKLILNSSKGRLINSPNSNLFIGTANMAPLAIFDLVHFQPYKIKVLKINFFLSNNAYYEGYSLNNNVRLKWQSFAAHNPITQINLIKNLWNAGYIEVDEQCEKILKMSPDEYFRKIEEIYIRKNV